MEAKKDLEEKGVVDEPQPGAHIIVIIWMPVSRKC